MVSLGDWILGLMETGYMFGFVIMVFNRHNQMKDAVRGRAS